jgi:hypothetical protein
MNSADVLKYGHRHFLRTLDGLPAAHWQTSGVCGVWSVKDVTGHLAAYEHLLYEILAPFAGMKTDTPYLNQIGEIGIAAFNDVQADARKTWPVERVQTEYVEAYERIPGLVAKMSRETWQHMGTLPWYGPEYSLDDYIVYSFYGHKREHSAQIAAFKDRLIVQ